MPILKHAKKKLRQDKHRTALNKKMKEVFRKLVKEAREVKSPEAVSKAFSAIDKAAMNNIMHKNKAAHMKSALSKVLAGGEEKVAVVKKVVTKKVAPKKTTKKTAKKK